MKLDLNEIEKRAKAATPGPWYVVEGDSYEYTMGYEYETDKRNSHTVSSDPKKAGWRTDSGYPDYCITKENATYIATMSPDVALKMVERIRELEDEID